MIVTLRQLKTVADLGIETGCGCCMYEDKALELFSLINAGDAGSREPGDDRMLDYILIDLDVAITACGDRIQQFKGRHAQETNKKLHRELVAARAGLDINHGFY